LEDVWPGSLHVITEFGERCPDDRVWAEAGRLNLVIITKDHDYADAMRFPGRPPQVVRLLILNAGTDAIEAHLRRHAVEINQFSTSGERYLEV
jgi:predicted nuclease of predicted toxin-antitoxin system